MAFPWQMLAEAGHSVGESIYLDPDEIERDERGNVKDPGKVKRRAALGSMFLGTKAIGKRGAYEGGFGDLTGRRYIDHLNKIGAPAIEYDDSADNIGTGGLTQYSQGYQGPSTLGGSQRRSLRGSAGMEEFGDRGYVEKRYDTTPVMFKNGGTVKNMYRYGGVVSHKEINIEDGELEVDPITGEIIREFDAPKHPKEGVHEGGDRFVEIGRAIIPARKAKEYRDADRKGRSDIIKSLPNHAMEKYEDGDQFVGDDIPLMEPITGYDTTGASPSTLSNPYPEPAPILYDERNQGSDRTSPYVNYAGGALGTYQYLSSSAALSKLNREELPTLTDYKVSPELQSAYIGAQERAKRGFTPEEEADYRRSIAGSAKAARQRQKALSGGSMAGALGAAVRSREVGALSKLAAQDADLKRRNIAYADSLGRALQSQRNLMTQGEREYERMLYNRRLLAEQSLGQAQQAGLTNIAGSFYQPPS